MKPLQRFGARLAAESPWVVVVFGSTFFGALPLFVYPLYKDYVNNSARHQRENERVRLCLQKGIDPYPFLVHKGYSPGKVVMEKQEIPTGISWEKESVNEQLRRTEALRQEVGGKPSDSVDRLLWLRRQQQQKRLREEYNKYYNDSNYREFAPRAGVNEMRS